MDLIHDLFVVLEGLPRICRWTCGLQVDWMLATELFIDLFFLSDIVLNFNTGYISDQVRHFCIYSQ